MAFVKPQFAIGFAFQCMAPGIRSFCKMFADSGGGPGSFVIAFFADEAVMNSGVPDPENYLAILKKKLFITELIIVIDSQEFRVYRANMLWVTQLRLDLLSGRVSINDPSPCARMVGYGSPLE